MTATSTKESHAAVAAKLPDSALVLLTHAAQRTDGMVLPQSAPIRARGSALKRLLQRLLRLGLIAEVVIDQADQAWRTNEDGTRIGLQITAAGQDAIGVDEAQHAHHSPGAAGSGEDPRARQVDSDQAADPSAGDAAPQRGRSNRSAATTRRQHGASADQRDGATSDPGKPQGRRSPAMAQHRPGSKQALLVEHLSRPQGQSITKLSKILGWQAHTIRAAITGLRKRGYAIARHVNGKGETVYRAMPPGDNGGTEPGISIDDGKGTAEAGSAR